MTALAWLAEASVGNRHNVSGLLVWAANSTFSKLRSSDPARFYLRRHKRKLKRRTPRVTDWRLGTNFMDELRIDWDLVI